MHYHIWCLESIRFVLLNSAALRTSRNTDPTFSIQTTFEIFSFQDGHHDKLSHHSATDWWLDDWLYKLERSRRIKAECNSDVLEFFVMVSCDLDATLLC